MLVVASLLSVDLVLRQLASCFVRAVLCCKMAAETRPLREVLATGLTATWLVAAIVVQTPFGVVVSWTLRVRMTIRLVARHAGNGVRTRAELPTVKIRETQSFLAIRSSEIPMNVRSVDQNNILHKQSKIVHKNSSP